MTIAFSESGKAINSPRTNAGISYPEQVTRTQNRPVDRGVSCIPLFHLRSAIPSKGPWHFRQVRPPRIVIEPGRLMITDPINNCTKQSGCWRLSFWTCTRSPTKPKTSTGVAWFMVVFLGKRWWVKDIGISCFPTFTPHFYHRSEHIPNQLWPPNFACQTQLC